MGSYLIEIGSKMNQSVDEIELEPEQKIYNLDQKPFENFEQAAQMRDLLKGQSNHYFRVELFDPDDQLSGFIVVKTENTQDQGGVGLLDESDESDKATQEDAEKIADQIKNGQLSETETIYKIYHPALRTYFLRIPLLLVGFMMFFFALELWVLFLSLLGLGGLPEGISPDLLVNGTQMIGGILILWLMSGALLNFYGTKLTIDHRGITYNQGILSRDITNVRFSEIRTIGLRQGVFDRLLNIGILEFASSGTDDVDIRFINMPNPAGVKAEIEGLIERHG
jgi:hypothetical protein